MPGTGVGDSGISISAISRGNLEPAAEARMADSRKADALWLSPVTRYVPLTFAPLHRPEADLHFCTCGLHNPCLINIVDTDEAEAAVGGSVGDG